LATEGRRAFRNSSHWHPSKPKKRGWTLDVLNAVRSLNKPDFSLAEIYAREDSLAERQMIRAVTEGSENTSRRRLEGMA
jgi:hypothetical protein